MYNTSNAIDTYRSDQCKLIISSCRCLPPMFDILLHFIIKDQGLPKRKGGSDSYLNSSSYLSPFLSRLVNKLKSNLTCRSSRLIRLADDIAAYRD